MPKSFSLAINTCIQSTALVFALNTAILNTTYAAPPTEYVDYQKIQQEERAWAGLQSKTLRVGDIVWNYSEGGRVGQPTILLIHGIGGSRDTWNDVAKTLSKQYHVIIPDLPGSGYTQMPKDFNFGVENLTEQLRRFVEANRIQNNLNVAGHSIGGTIAQLYAAKYNFDTKSLFLISSGGFFKSNQTTYLNNPIYLKQLNITQVGDLDFALKKVMQNPPFVPSIIRKQQEQVLITKSADTAKLISELTQLNKTFNVDSYASMLKNIEAPTAILWGKQDQIVNVEIAQELKAKIKHAQPPILLNNVGHVPILEAPEKVTQTYLEFLNTVQSQPNVASTP